MKKSFFVRVVANVAIFTVLTSVFVFAFSGGSLSASSGENDSPIYRGNQLKNNISLSFNVYFGTEYIMQIMEILSENGAKATFFVGGLYAENNPTVLQKMVELDMQIGNHGYFNLDHKKLSAEKNREEIVVTEKMIESICGVKTKLFSPPMGSFSKTTLSVCKNLGYKVIMQSKESLDLRHKDADLILENATKNLKNGDIILLHPTELTLNALPRIIETIKSRGFNLVTVGENISS